ncbi:MAG: hypothetical protein A2W72_12325 [Burkholderiales bacterium RIFCSPLOWO2_12_67_14]|nr:MAG: hypothetical protein A2W72_12325 [Burkholderiales bacterium RIFCSPLOWO2_12_67_14]
MAGCGGSGTEASAQKAASVLMVDGWVQPASVDQGVSNIKSRSALVTAPTPSRVSLGALDASKTASLGGGIGPRQVGTARDVVATRAAAQTQQQLQWKPTATGGKVAAISFSAEGAYGLRLGVVVKALPQGTVLRVYSQANASKVFQISGQEVLQRIERNAQAGDTTLDGQTWWTPDTGSDEATLELELPDLGLIPIRDAETGEQLLVDTHDKGFRQRFARIAAQREAQLRESLARAGVDTLELATDDDLADVVLRFVELRRRRSSLRAGLGGHLGARAMSPRPAAAVRSTEGAS